MGSPVNERGDWWTLFHHSDSDYTGGFTASVDVDMFQGDYAVHCGLSRMAATTRRPMFAAIGIRSMLIRHPGETAFHTVDFGTNSADWPALVYGHLRSFTYSVEVGRCQMSCWMFLQAWAA